MAEEAPITRDVLREELQVAAAKIDAALNRLSVPDNEPVDWDGAVMDLGACHGLIDVLGGAMMQRWAFEDHEGFVEKSLERTAGVIAAIVVPCNNPNHNHSGEMN